MRKKYLEQRVAHLMDVCDEITAKALPKRLNDLEAQILCGVTYGHRITLVRYLGTCYVFRCINCGLKYNRPEDNLTKKESELVVLVYSEQKKGEK